MKAYLNMTINQRINFKSWTLNPYHKMKGVFDECEECEKLDDNYYKKIPIH